MRKRQHHPALLNAKQGPDAEFIECIGGLYLTGLLSTVVFCGTQVPTGFAFFYFTFLKSFSPVLSVDNIFCLEN